MTCVLAPSHHSRYVERCFQKAQINFRQLYLWLYITFSAWYQQEFSTTNDRSALQKLKRSDLLRHLLCEGALNGSAKHYLYCLSEYSYRHHLSTTKYWNGVVERWSDWPSIVEYWYMTRCSLVHGDQITTYQAELSYQTLNTFLSSLFTYTTVKNPLPHYKFSV